MKSDQLLKKEVCEELIWDADVNETEIGVEVKDGIVTLSGHLKSYAEKLAAERATQRVTGVKGIAVEMDVTLPGSSKRSDTDIARAAQIILEWNVLVPNDSIKIRVENGVITLSGKVERDSQRFAAENSLAGLMGVKTINNLITLTPAAMPKDIKVKIEAALQRRAHEEARDISVDIDGEQVTLSGYVSALSEQRAVLRAALSAKGVTRVVNHLSVF